MKLVGGLSTELLCVLHKVDKRECNRHASEKQKQYDERMEHKCAMVAAREAKKVEAKRHREEEHLSRPKKP